MAGFDDNFLQELKIKNDIVDVISAYVPLQKKGGRYFGRCPFHNEKTGSFCVSRSSQFYHCFGCHASGDVIKFVQEIESLTFFEAVKYLAEKVGMPMPEFKSDPNFKQKTERKDTLKQIMRETAVYYRNNLKNEEKGMLAREYLAGRGVSDDVAAYFGLGLSIGYDNLGGYLRRKGFSVKDIEAVGLVYGDRVTDSFANRIIVPIINNMNEVVAFGGRIYQGESETAKYKNSTNTELFDKSRTVYGINFIKKLKKDGVGFRSLILVEGYMDVIALVSAGIKNVVAGMGTALTELQVREIKKLTDRVFVCYDGDGAGKKATIRNAQLLEREGLEVKIISLADGLDPDDTIRLEGVEGFAERQKKSLSLVEYKLELVREANDTNSNVGRAKYVKSALDVIKSIKSKSEREVYLKIVSDISGVSIESLIADADVYTIAPVETKKEKSETASKTTLAQRFVVNQILNNAEYVDFDDINRLWFEPKYQQVIDFALTYDKGKVVVGDIFAKIEDTEINSILSENPKFESKSREHDYYLDCLNLIANDYIKDKISSLKAEFATLSDPDKKRESLGNISKYQSKLKSRDIKDKI